MATNASPSLSVSPCGDGRPGTDPLRTVVWVRGEQDVATVGDLSVTISYAARLDDADIVVDLSGVTFMDASTIGVFVVARDSLRDRSRSLSVRDPSPRARRLLTLCGLTELIDEGEPVQTPRATALGSWVDVPAQEVDPETTPSPVAQALFPEPVRAPARPSGESVGAVQHRQAPS